SQYADGLSRQNIEADMIKHDLVAKRLRDVPEFDVRFCCLSHESVLLALTLSNFRGISSARLPRRPGYPLPSSAFPHSIGEFPGVFTSQMPLLLKAKNFHPGNSLGSRLHVTRIVDNFS